MGQRIRANADGLNSSRRASPVLWALLAIVLVGLGSICWWAWRSPDEAKRTLDNLQTTIQTATTGALSSDSATDTDNVTTSTPDADTSSTPSETAELQPTSPLTLVDEEPLNPIEAPEELASSPLPALDTSDTTISSALNAWGATQQTRSLIRNDRFVRRFVATVDNLTSPRAPAEMWPVHPTTPRFTVADSSSGVETHIAEANNARYALAVQLVSNLNVQQAARDYRHFYPLFQQAYEDLGYPNRYFNDRLIAVIDHLVQAPEPLEPRVHLVKVRGQVPSEQPWVRYEYEDPQLEALSSGQKILVRMGPDNARKVKAKLREFRTAIATTPVAGTAPATTE